MWNAQTRLLLHTLKGHTDTVTSVAFSVPGDRLASASSDATVRVWDAKTGQSLHTLNGHTDTVNSVAFSGAGDRLASASSDATVRVWDAKTGQPLHTFEDTGFVTNVAFSSDGLYLKTERGSLLLPLTALSTSAPTPHSPAQRIFVLDRWVKADSEDILWIPAEYQPSCIAVHSCHVTFGYSFGRVLLLGLL
jgi:WD40 repeat protein